MENFIFHNPTVLHFGKNVTNQLGSVLLSFGQRVLLVYGGGSIKRNGIYNQLMIQLQQSGLKVFEYGGIRSNPVIEDVEAAAKVGRDNDVDMILAVGGGSVIDSAKVIAVTIPVSHPAWDFFENKARPAKALPLVDILTLAATGSETNAIAVVTNHSKKTKAPLRSALMFPKHAFLDPQNTFSVPLDYTSYGITDLIAHSLEFYFGHGDAPLTDRYILETIKEAIEKGPKLLKEPENYDLRATIMYAANCALNGSFNNGKTSGDWGVHGLGHVLSLLYDLPHGASLSIIYPAWMKIMGNRIPDRIIQLGKSLFDVDTVEDTIRSFEDFFELIGSPFRISQYVDNADKNLIVDTWKMNKANGMCHQLTSEDYRLLADLI